MVSDLPTLIAAINIKTERGYSNAQVKEFVGLAESMIRRKLMGYQREITTTLVTDADGFAALPSDFIGFSGITLNGKPYRYSIGGAEVYVADGSGQTFDAVYYGRLPSLTDADSTNWLMDVAPDVYYLLTEAQARSFNEEWQLANALKMEGLSMLEELNLQTLVAQYGRAGMRLPVQAI